ncbi:MAG TPA: universal stress protein [Kofleriaceae bacterium]|nr:universal stress protein [Kofleriaceae bacterium]
MSIICGTDLSAASAGALDVAIALAKLYGHREVVLAHIIDPELGGSAAARERALEDARTALDAQAAALRPGDPAVRTELIVGPPDASLVELAEAEGSELIVIRARSTSSSLLRLGTTTAKVIARTSVPVLVIREPDPWLKFASGERPLRLLLGIDDSAVCDLGIQWTQGLAARGPVEIVLGAIYYPDDAAAHYGVGLRGMVDSDPDIERLMARDLARRFGTLGGGGGGASSSGSDASRSTITTRPRRGLGRIGDHVVELANEEKVDAIIVGTGQKTGLGRLGSVSSIIVNDAPQSVVCVPPQANIPTMSLPEIRSALVATDLSPFSNRAVPYAFALVANAGAAGAAEPAEVHIVHVVKDDDDAEVDEAAITAQLYALAPKGARPRVHAHLVRGEDAAIALAQCAAHLGVDVICIASHGRSGITRALVGSVADRLLRATRRPVLVLRPA